jgi:hypothetical protein
MEPFELVIHAVKLTGLSAEQIFRRAYEYYEDRKSKKYIVYRYMDFVHRDTVPQVVQDYCLEILSHRTEITK